MVKKSQTKTLFTLSIDGAKVNIKCTYYLKTNYVGIATFRTLNYIKRTKKIPTFTMNKRTSTCAILKQHSKNMQGDPERLTTVQIFDIMEDTINGKIKNEIPDSISVLRT